jgi:proteasome accessory factor C
MSTAAARFRRLMTVLPRFAEHDTHRLDDLATECCVPVEQLSADLQALADRFDDPGGYVEGVAVMIDGDRVSVRTDHFRRPMRLTVAELCALELGLALLEREHDGEATTTHPMAQLRARLATLITRLPQDAAYDGLRDGALAHPAQARAVPRLRDALRRRRVVTLQYQKDHDDVAQSRTVRPYALRFSRGAWYLSGWCERSDGLRLFRCDRIVDVTLIDREHEVPADFSPDQLMVDGKVFHAGEPSPVLTVRYSTGIARWIAERDGGLIESDGSALRSMPLADREWAIRHVLQYGPDAQIVSPVELRDELRDRIKRMIDHR